MKNTVEVYNFTVVKLNSENEEAKMHADEEYLHRLIDHMIIQDQSVSKSIGENDNETRMLPKG